ncbi:MFS transporter [Streptomyces sp. NBC_00654]|uniref:MFS transporter n=1 Tax=Streptomyces sp. NBC_00654 TaxID=2975799 RepID=UPI00225C3313|nr:MFS transporter [Streptomyces sp. NBC_00654]MCX4967193.1 MFS transporter [Streptomyces sp. NBC_00654]
MTVPSTAAPVSRAPAVPTTRLISDPTVRRIAALLSVNAVGNGLFLTISTLWFTQGLGYSTSRVGLALTVAGLCGILASLPAGRACDRWSAKSVLTFLHLLQAAAIGLYAVADSFPVFLALACLATAGSRANATARGTLYAHALHVGIRTRALALLRAVNNVGIGAGAALGSVLLAFDSDAAYRGAICVSATAFLLALIPLRRIPTATRPPAAQPAAARDVAVPERRAPHPLRDLPYLAVTALNAVVNTLYVVLEVALPLWLLTCTSAPRAMVGWLLVTNTALVVALQVRAARGITGPAQAARAFRLGGLLVAAACLAAACAAHRSPVTAGAVLLAAVVLLTLGEVTSQAGSWTLSYDLAPNHAHGTYQGIYQTGISVSQALGPGLLTTFVLPHGTAGWTVLAALFASAALALPLAARRAAQESEQSKPTHYCG